MPVRIYGAGMAGLLTAAMLRRLRPVVHEAQAELPNNHGALLRFRTDAVQRETGQRFRRVNVLKAVKSGNRLRPVATIQDANQYAFKVTGEIQPRSVLDLTPCERYIAPDDFITTMARDVVLKMGAPLTKEVLDENVKAGYVTISTIPMNVLMSIVGWPGANFRWRPIWSVRVDIQRPVTDVYQTVYYPEAEAPYYRASMTGDTLIIEYLIDPDGMADSLNRATRVVTPIITKNVTDVLTDFGIPSSATFSVNPPKRQEYGKLVPLDKQERQTFILAMTDQYNCYSVGRFATWRQILLDDVVQDVRRVETWITQRSEYERRLDRT
jgi:hypothetical protein